MSALQKRFIRCAIDTRKSAEEGLEQSFNSLDAQREACQAYILSQRQEGSLLVQELRGCKRKGVEFSLDTHLLRPVHFHRRG
jgi:hypothetical protein